MAHRRVVGEGDHLLDQPLAAVVGRVGLAGDHDLHRPGGVQQQGAQPLRVAQHQGEPLVRGHTAGEADGEHVGVEHRGDPAELGLAGPALAPGGAQPAAGLLHQLGAQAAAQVPDLGVADPFQTGPALGVAGGHRFLGAFGAELGGAQAHHGRVDPGGGVHPVGDRGDRHLGGVEAGPQAVEHRAADLAVQGGDPVGALGQPQAHRGHVEELRVPAAPGLGTEREHRLDRDAGQCGVAAEVAGDQVAVEAVDAGRDGRVGGEQGAGPDGLQGGGEVEPGRPVGDQFADPLDAEEAGVALVGVEDLGGGVPGQPAVGTHGPDAADAEQHLLEQPVLAAASVEPVGDIAFGGRVGLDVGVEQQQGDPPDLGLPDVRRQGAAAGQGEVDPARGAVGLPQQADGQFVRVQEGVALLLPADPVEGLPEVAVPVEQPHADDRDAEVAGGLEVVAGQDAEAAGVLGQRGGDAVLGREVGDGGGRRGGAALLVGLVPARAGEVLAQVVGEVAESAQEPPVGGECGEPGGRDLPEQPHRVLAGRGPDLRVHGPEEVPGLGVPGPAQVEGQLVQRLELFGQDGADGESADCLHRREA